MNGSSVHATAVDSAAMHPVALWFSVACLVFIVAGSVRQALHAHLAPKH